MKSAEPAIPIEIAEVPMSKPVYEEKGRKAPPGITIAIRPIIVRIPVIVRVRVPGVIRGAIIIGVAVGRGVVWGSVGS